MIVLTKRNGEKFLLNHNQIMTVEQIPESKIVMMNRDFYIVKETPEGVRQGDGRTPGSRGSGQAAPRLKRSRRI